MTTSSDNASHVLIMAGGTGGHVFPALAVAHELVANGCRVSWLGTAAGIEARLVPAAGFMLHTIDVSGLRGKGLVSRIMAPVMVWRALWQALKLLRRLKPALVVGMGGFAAGPGGLAARLVGKPLLIHEQNAAAGLTNRLLSRLASTVLQAFPDTFPTSRRPRTVGNPVRKEILALPAPAWRWVDRTGPLRLLVLGGSGGALALNEAVPEMLARLAPEQQPEVWHQAGRTLAAAQQAYAKYGVQARLDAFIDDVAEAYGWADMVLCRSGALTVAELAGAGVGAVLVPYPYAVDDHQRVNGNYLVTAGAARLIDQKELTAKRLWQELTELGCSREQLLTRAEAARAVAWTDATSEIATACHQLMGVAA